MAHALSMPVSSWVTIKQVIRAYGVVEENDNPKVDEVAEIAGIPRPVVSANNNFLREIGVIADDENKPTPLGSKLAASLSMENESLVAEMLQEVVRANPTLNQWVGMVRARGSVEYDFLKGTIAIAGNLTDKGKQSVAARTIIELLQESRLIQINDNIIKAGMFEGSNRHPGDSFVSPSAPQGPPAYSSPNAPMGPGSLSSPNVPMGQRFSAIPLPLGPSRLAYIQLPEDWNVRELPKLIKILQIALGDSEES